MISYPVILGGKKNNIAQLDAAYQARIYFVKKSSKMHQGILSIMRNECDFFHALFHCWIFFGYTERNSKE